MWLGIRSSHPSHVAIQHTAFVAFDACPNLLRYADTFIGCTVQISRRSPALVGRTSYSVKAAVVDYITCTKFGPRGIIFPSRKTTGKLGNVTIDDGGISRKRGAVERDRWRTGDTVREASLSRVLTEKLPPLPTAAFLRMVRLSIHTEHLMRRHRREIDAKFYLVEEVSHPRPQSAESTRVEFLDDGVPPTKGFDGEDVRGQKRPSASMNAFAASVVPKLESCSRCLPDEHPKRRTPDWKSL
ncbi:uncharacterized protein EV420DRAFT_1476860 [Desarmillaria tabescens]|uniref:Uncharacterized protein n=1 Tax=Armillaria tabescens TaxID=1929756 RepID=A0AA39NCK3_ARMTA|nr:uncharacterized protein EV420DRAFT_1476860 [Desarmillaria tabescens]KAK0463119.1 hypothetical protein EV420DRAFT_1476860 [Desarmillaria tabescens]